MASLDGARETLLRLVAERARDDPADGVRHVVRDRRRALSARELVEGRDLVRAVVRRRADEHLEEHRAERPHIGAMIDRKQPFDCAGSFFAEDQGVYVVTVDDAAVFLGRLASQVRIRAGTAAL